MRNSGQRGYRPKQASEKAHERSLNCRNAERVDQTVLNRAFELVKEEWSPEQIAGTLQISLETIYRHVYEKKDQGNTLVKHLRSQKKRRKRYYSA